MVVNWHWHSNRPQWLRRYWLLPAVLVVVLVVAPLTYNAIYAGKIYPGLQVGSLAVGNLTPEQAKLKVGQTWDRLAQRGWQVLLADGRQVTLPATVTAPGDPDLTYSLVSVNIEATIDKASAWGRTGNRLQQLWQPLWSRLTNPHLPLAKDLEPERLVTFLRENFSSLEQPPLAADLALDAAGNLQVTPARAGTLINQEQLMVELSQRLDNFSDEPISLQINHQAPTIIELKVAELLPPARTWLINTTVNLTYDEHSWQLTPTEWQPWLGVEEVAGQVQVGLISTKAVTYFAELAQTVDQSAQDARFEIKDGRVVQFRASQTGRQLQVTETLKAIQQTIRSASNQTVTLVVATEEPQLTTAEANDWGIAELIGVGKSNFSGSPKNRRHNIKVGADTLNGVLIKPDEEFSLVKTLGEIDGAHGYLQELVIKGNKTIPEYGGGLCQIGTTTFRATLASGLPIVERKNHSYRVVYYEPAGTDATIYDPKPDFRFTNDTGKAILIQTRIDGDNLIFEFWGTKDGRLAAQTTPRIFNITAPPPTKIIETEDLPVGQKKCTERAHAGADTEFTYTVIYADGSQEEEVFKSHYVPWQEVCLLGVPKGTLQQPADEATVLPSASTAGSRGN